MGHNENSTSESMIRKSDRIDGIDEVDRVDARMIKNMNSYQNRKKKDSMLPVLRLGVRSTYYSDMKNVQNTRPDLVAFSSGTTSGIHGGLLDVLHRVGSLGGRIVSTWKEEELFATKEETKEETKEDTKEDTEEDTEGEETKKETKATAETKETKTKETVVAVIVAG